MSFSLHAAKEIICMSYLKYGNTVERVILRPQTDGNYLGDLRGFTFEASIADDLQEYGLTIKYPKLNFDSWSSGSFGNRDEVFIRTTIDGFHIRFGCEILELEEE